jgi:hypothetical protein
MPLGELTSLGEELHEKVDSVSGTKRNQAWDEAAIGFAAVPLMELFETRGH